MSHDFELGQWLNSYVERIVVERSRREAVEYAKNRGLGKVRQDIYHTFINIENGVKATCRIMFELEGKNHDSDTITAEYHFNLSELKLVPVGCDDE